MFEGKTLQHQFAETGDGLALREIAWADLVARLAVAKELRSEFDRTAGIAGGGFSQFAKLAARAEDKGKRAVNRNALGAGKSDAAKAQMHVTEASTHAAIGD